ncbi:MAG: hypothetical protein JNK02_16805 [Planctomycetes bacterium]|nr:hypothetical protein [Planctomycetota bacterium]
MIAALILAATPTVASPADPPRWRPREATWAELQRTTFDLAYLLPDDLEFAPGGGGAAVDLAREMRQLSAEVYAARPDLAGAPRSFGDVVQAWRAAPDAGARRRVLADLPAANPALASGVAAWAEALLCDERFRARSWDPDREDPCDGFLFARPFTLAGRSEKAWRRRDGGDLVQQAAVLVFADLEAIKSAENDYASYPSRPGASYERIGPLEGTYLAGRDPLGAPFSALRIRFETDLPFPFSSFTCDLHVLNRVDERGRLVCDVYSTSRDFHWLVGRDYYFPVRTSAGEFVAMLVVRRYGFDLRGVPDGDAARRAALRSSLGGLRRAAEDTYRAYGGPPRTVEGRFPDFEVLGKPQR